ncbi:MAG: isoprenylcysteine carboxylmethyltransferase family protein [Verrucomicrobia bacterium]|nr:isoprenylcysteine carboxylmethyltransferase family protein [Verrucomicrobiota bacterium]
MSQATTPPHAPKPATGHALDSLTLPVGRFFFRWRNTLFPIIFVAAALILRPTPFLGSTRADYAAIAFGAIMILAGQVVRCITIGLAYIKRGGRDKKVYADELVQVGIYAHSRNPMYLGNLLIAAGFCLLYGSPWMYGAVLPFFIFVYLCIVREEERYLAETFGSVFSNYRRTVPRFWPKANGLLHTMRTHAFDLQKVVSKEYGTILATGLGLYALVIYKLGLVAQLASPSVRQFLLALPLVLLTVFYIATRAMKKTGRLGPP